MQAEINGLMMAKKNSAVLWTVDQTGDVIGKDGRTTAQGNVGLGSDFVKSAKTDNAYVTHVSRDSTTGNLVVHTKQPELSELKGLNGTNKNQSIITDSQGNIVNQALSDTQQTGQNTTTSFVSEVTQNGNGSVVVTTSDITSAAVGTSGIVPLIADITDVNHAIITNKEDHAVTPLGVKDAIDTLDVNDSAVTHKYVSSVSESNGKISVSREFLTLESINPEELHKGKTVGINATTGAIEPQDLSTVEEIEDSTPTNRFVSSIDQASNGQISYTTQQLKAAASNSIGGIKIGYTEPSPNTDKKYAVQLDSEKAYVQVPWENTHYTSKNVICKSASGTDDTAVSTSETAFLNHVENGSVTDFHKIVGNGITVAYDKDDKKLTLTSNSGTVTSISAGTGLTTNPSTGITGTGSISLNTAGNNSLGGIKLGYTDSTVGSKNYAVNVDSNGKAYVNVPWTGTVTSISAGNGLTTNQTGGGSITSSGSISVKADGTSITVGSSGIKVADPLPTHDTTTSGKYLGVKNDGTTDWLTVPQNVPIYTDYTGATSVVGWKIATTKVPTSDNYDSSSVSAWVTIRSRGATSNPRNQGTLFAGYMWINYRGNGTSTPTISTVFNSLTNYTNGWKLYRNQYTESDRYVSDWYVCLPSTVQWIEITIHVLGTVGSITLCTDRVSEIGSGWNVAIEASKTPFMIGSGGVGGPNQPVYVNDDGKIVASSQIHTINIGGTETELPSYVTGDQYSEIQAAANNHEDLAVWYNASSSRFQYYYNGSTSSGYLFYRVGATEVSILQVDHAPSGQNRHNVTITTHQYDSSTQAEYLYSQGVLQNFHYSTIEAGTISSQGGGGAAATVLLTESTDTNLSNIVTQLKMSSGQLLLKDTTANTQNHITSSQIQLTSGNIIPITINTTGFATSDGTNSVSILNTGSGITATDANGTSTFTGVDGANHWGGYSISVGTLPSQGNNVIAFL